MNTIAQREALDIQTAFDGLWSWDVAGDSLQTSDRWRRLVGWRSGSPCQCLDDWLGLIHPDSRDAMQALLRACVEGHGRYFEQEHRCMHRGGEYRWMLLRGGWVQRRGEVVARLAGSYSRISARKQREASVRRIEFEHASILSSALDAILMTDEDGRITEFNAAAEALFGYRRHEALERNLADLITPAASREAQRLRLRMYLDTGEAAVLGQRVDVAAIRADGSRVDCEMALSSMNGEDGRCFTVNLRDVSERHRFEDELLRAKEQAEQASQAKSEFLSAISHELRTPLNAILGFAQLLEADPDEPLSEEQQESVREIHDSGASLLALIDDIIKLASIDAGGTQVVLEPVAVSPLLRDCMAALRPLAQGLRVRLRSVEPATEEAGPTVVADPRQLRVVLSNLLSNAIKYNHDDGEVWVECESVGDRLRIAVHDTGLGLSDPELTLAFDPFVRLHAGTKAVPGTGIGLTLSRRLTQAMHGRIGADSEPGRGSRFWLELPLHKDAGPAPEDLSGANARQRSILYFPARPEAGEHLRSLLSARPDLHLILADGDRPALEVAERYLPDLILIDEDLDPTVQLSQLLGISRAREIPVVVFSSGADETLRDRFAGATEFITQPMNEKRLLAAIGKLLEADVTTTGG